MKKFSDWFSGGKKEKLILCFLFGIFLLVIAIPTKQDKADTIELEQLSVSTNASLLEREVEQILCKIEGVGMVDAMITLEPFVDDEETQKIQGILIVTQSGDDPVQILKIQEAVMTLFQINAHRIKVMKLKEI